MTGVKQLLPFLNAVKGWFENGNKATFSHVVPISIDIFGDHAYVRHLQEEHFVDEQGGTSKFIGEFASIMKKVDGHWRFYRTSFQQRYRGPIIDDAPSLLPD